MRLMIVDDDGTAHEVVPDLESYNLEKRLARAAIVNAIANVLARLQAANAEPAPPPEYLPIDRDGFVCLCGNRPATDGFYPGNRLGHQVEPNLTDWPEKLLVCARCGRIIAEHVNQCEVVGRWQRAVVRRFTDEWVVQETLAGGECLIHDGFVDRDGALAYADVCNSE
jgi:hypothetical protein